MRLAKVIRLGIVLTVLWSGLSFAAVKHEYFDHEEDALSKCEWWVNYSNNTYFGGLPASYLGQDASTYFCYGNVGYNCAGYTSVQCYFTIPALDCSGELDNTWPEDTTGDGYADTCIADPCDGEPIEGGEPTAGEQAFYAAHGYSCTPASQGSCKIYPSAPLPGGGWMYFEHSEGGHCSVSEASDPDGTPTDSNTPGGDDPLENGGYGQCGSASPYDPFCAGDPSADCPNGNCRSGCGYFNADFICENPDYDRSGTDYGGSAPPPPDGDSTGDGIQNIDLGPTNALLQQIRNNTAAGGPIVQAVGGGASSENTPDYTALLTEIRDQTKGDQVAADVYISASETDLAAAETENEENEANAQKKDGTNQYFKLDTQDTEFHDELSDSTTNIGSNIGGMLGIGGACPVANFSAGPFSEDMDLDTVASVVRPMMTFMLWFMVGVNGYFIFFKWALS